MEGAKKKRGVISLDFRHKIPGSQETVPRDHSDVQYRAHMTNAWSTASVKHNQHVSELLSYYRCAVGAQHYVRV